MAARSQSWRPRLNVAWGAFLSLLGYAFASLLGAGGLRFVFGLLFLLFGFLTAMRWLSAWRRKLLWRLRNRLLFTYLFIAVIPILLIIGMVALTASLLYGQLAGYLIASDLQSKADQLGAASLALAGKLGGRGPQTGFEDPELRRWLDREDQTLQSDFPQLSLAVSSADGSRALPAQPGPVSCARVPDWVDDHFRGVIASGQGLFLHSISAVPGWRGARLCVTVPVTEELLARVGPDIGLFTLHTLEEVRPGAARGSVFVIGDRRYVSRGRLQPTGRTLPPPGYTFDPVLRSFSKFDVVQWDADTGTRQQIPVFLSITTRPSLLNQRIFAPLGEVAQALLALLLVSGVVFLGLQVVSLIIGVRLSRRITSATNDLYSATRRLQAGDFSVRIPSKHEDQLGALSESFNQMAASIERLIEESKQRQRLENELEVARQVQEQLFPREVPQLGTLQLLGRCRPARVVSGDYYDYGLADPGRLVFTIGDISGKGISAALLMATIQSILRSQVYACRLMGQFDQLSVAELVTRVNRQLCATTSTEKFSTLFVGFYDDNSRRLTYTNAGHLPPLLIGPRGTRPLDVGGPVVGVFSRMGYEEATVELQPGDNLVAFTDGLTEVENSYGEEYGEERLRAFLQRHADSLQPEQLIDAVMAELQQWAPGVEQSDDRTLLVARAC
jgi:sigma-B regulation protein RsbU (phosphoserine phosphatase)